MPPVLSAIARRDWRTPFAALPPWGWWPLAFVGIAALDRLIAEADRASRFRRGLLVGVGLYVPSLAWMIDMTAPGYVVAAIFYAALLALAAALRRRWLAAGLAVAVVGALAVVGVAGPRAEPVDTLGVALVQGGGPQGTRASDTDEREVFERHLAASDAITTPVDLVVWPEDVVDVDDPVAETREGRELEELAHSLDAPLVVGVVEDAGPDHFRNAAVAYDAEGDIVDRYDKVHRVPFGEYVPLRSLIEPFGGDDISSRDAIVGEHPADLDTPAGHLAVAISWEIFFGDRVREGVENGAEVVLNPTNGSSFTGTLVQTQQVATTRMRAIENDRWVLQVAPTGFSAIVGPDGTVHQRSAVSERTVLAQTVGMREGTTIYTRVGLLPAWILAVASLGLGWGAAWQARRRGRDESMAAPPPAIARVDPVPTPR